MVISQSLLPDTEMEMKKQQCLEVALSAWLLNDYASFSLDGDKKVSPSILRDPFCGARGCVLIC